MIKKLIKIKIFLPILIILTLLGFFIGYFQANNSASLYTAKMTIFLGNMDKENRSNPDVMRKKVLSSTFLEETLRISPEEVQNIKGKITINKVDETTAEIVMKDSQNDNLEEIVSSIAMKYLENVKSYSDEKNKIIDNTIDRLNDEKVSEEEVYDVEKYLYTLNVEKLNIEQPTVVESVQIVEEAPNAIKAGILSSLLTFSLLIACYLILVVLNIRKYLD